MNKQQLLLRKKAPKDIDQIEESFQLVVSKIQPASSQVMLMKTRYISIDPIMRVWISMAKTYLDPLELNDVIHGFALSSPIDNLNDFYFGPSGLQTHFLYDKNNKKKQLLKIPKQIIQAINKSKIHISNILTIILNGLPSYYGLIDFCKITKGQNVVISTCSGATGLFCIQIALILECNVYGITGSDKKIEFLKTTFPSLKVLNYKNQNWHNELQDESIDAYFDNVGGEMLDKLILKMKKNGRIALCGSMGSSSNYQERIGLENLNQAIYKRLKIKGITFNQELNKVQDALKFLFNEIQSQRIQIIQSEFKQLSDVPNALKQLFQGNNIGKVIINLDNYQSKL